MSEKWPRAPLPKSEEERDECVAKSWACTLWSCNHRTGVVSLMYEVEGKNAAGEPRSWRHHLDVSPEQRREMGLERATNEEIVEAAAKRWVMAPPKPAPAAPPSPPVASRVPDEWREHVEKLAEEWADEAERIGHSCDVHKDHRYECRAAFLLALRRLCSGHDPREKDT